MKSTTYYCKPEKSPSKIFQLVVDPIQNSGLELSHFFPLEKKNSFMIRTYKFIVSFM